MYLHASAVQVRGRALLFLGHSTAGKSTISRLLSGRYPIIADDKVWVSLLKNGTWMVCDGHDNFASAADRARAMKRLARYPLLAVLRIFKAKTNGLEPISARQTCRHLMDAVFEVDCQRTDEKPAAMKKRFALAAALAKKKEGWHLTFKNDLSILETISGKFDSRTQGIFCGQE